MTRRTGALRPPDSIREVRSDGTGGMLGGSLLAALAAYAFLQGGARVLGADRFAAISALWTVQFLAMAVAILPLEQMTIRNRSLGSDGRRSVVLVVPVLAALAAAGYAAATVNSLFSGDHIYIVMSALGVMAMAVFAVGRGELAGRLRFREYGIVTGGQAMLRLIAGLALIVLTDSAIGGGWAIVLSPLIVVFWWPRSSPTARAEAPAAAGSFLAGIVLANAAAQLILVAGPLAVEWLGGTAAAVSVLFVTLTLFRAPLAVANNVLARLLPPFAALAANGQTHRLRQWGIRLPALTMAAAVVALGAAAWLGPAVTAALFGSDFRPGASTAAFIAAGSVLATGASFANQILVALGATWRLAVAWAVGLAAALTVLGVVGGDPATRVAAAFLGGQAAAVALVALQVQLCARSRSPG